MHRQTHTHSHTQIHAPLQVNSSGDPNERNNKQFVRKEVNDSTPTQTAQTKWKHTITHHASTCALSLSLSHKYSKRAHTPKPSTSTTCTHIYMDIFISNIDAIFIVFFDTISLRWTYFFALERWNLRVGMHSTFTYVSRLTNGLTSVIPFIWRDLFLNTIIQLYTSLFPWLFASCCLCCCFRFCCEKKFLASSIAKMEFRPNYQHTSVGRIKLSIRKILSPIYSSLCRLDRFKTPTFLAEQIPN